MTTDRVGRAQAWLEEFLAEDRLEEINVRWRQFVANELPVVTLFGAYDTGKSALLRRLLVDQSLEVPEWLTISARHETYEVGRVDFRGSVLRDAPGVAPGAGDARAVANTGHALDAVALTDVLLIVMNPQLPTAERELMITVLGGDWPTGSVVLVISRFDDAGVSPEYDLTGYRELGERKVAELRRSLELDSDVLVFVVAPDFEQAAGSLRQPDASVWDESRSWDGMSELSDVLGEVAGADLTVLRSAAEDRYWVGWVAASLEQAREDLQELEVATKAARSLRSRRDSFLAEIKAQEEASRVSINGAVEEAIRSTMRRQSVDAAAIENAVNQTLDAWWTAQNVELDRVLRDAQSAMDQQRDRPAWKALADMYVPDAEPKSEPKRKITGKLGGLGAKARDAVRAVDKLREESQKGLKARAASAAGSAQSDAAKSPSAPRVPKIEVAIAAVPVVIELFGMIEDEAGDRKAAAARRARRVELQDQVTAIATRAGEATMRHWAPHLADVRAHLMEMAGNGAEDVELLESLVAAATALVSRGELVLGPA